MRAVRLAIAEFLRDLACKKKGHGAPAARAAARTSACVSCVNGVSIGCHSVQPGTVANRELKAMIGPQINSQARRQNDFFDSIGQERTRGFAPRTTVTGLEDLSPQSRARHRRYRSARRADHRFQASLWIGNHTP